MYRLAAVIEGVGAMELALAVSDISNIYASELLVEWVGLEPMTDEL